MCWKRILLLILLLSCLVVYVDCRSRGRNTKKLALWIDEDQVKILAGMQFTLDIIQNGKVNEVIYSEPIIANIPPIPPYIDTVNLTWQGGEHQFRYWFENLTSLDQHLLYNPLLSVPAHGWIPLSPTVFQMSIPCTGKDEGIASIVLGLQIYTRQGHPVQNTPISFKLKKQCKAFVMTSQCESGCHNGGTCENGICLCGQGFSGKFCEIALCNPRCENNGTCVSPKVCACPTGYSGNHCEKAMCGSPCQNGGHCLKEGFCFCQEGFYGKTCELSRCNDECIKKGTCEQEYGTPCPKLIKPDADRLRRRIEDSGGVNKTNDKKIKRKRRKDREAILVRKMVKAERRIVKIIMRKSKAFTLTREDRRKIRKIGRETKTRPLNNVERNFLVEVMTRERDKLKKKERQKLKRYKKLIKIDRKRRSRSGKTKTKTKTKTKRRKLFV